MQIRGDGTLKGTTVTVNEQKVAFDELLWTCDGDVITATYIVNRAACVSKTPDIDVGFKAGILGKGGPDSVHVWRRSRGVKQVIGRVKSAKYEVSVRYPKGQITLKRFVNGSVVEEILSCS